MCPHAGSHVTHMCTLNAVGALNCPHVAVGLTHVACLFCVSQLFMVGMKRDCGGAAGILGAFYTAIKLVSKV